jgi:hypothetical protein
MQLKEALGRIALHLPRHASNKEVVIMEAPRTGPTDAWKYTQARWSTSDYQDPWPTRG